MRMCGSGSGSAWNQQYSSSGAERGSVGVVVVHGQPVIRASLSRLALTQTQQERLARTPASLSLSVSLYSLSPSLFSRSGSGSLFFSLSLSLLRPSAVPVSGSVLAAIAGSARAGGKRLSVNKT